MVERGEPDEIVPVDVREPFPLVKWFYRLSCLPRETLPLPQDTQAGRCWGLAHTLVWCPISVSQPGITMHVLPFPSSMQNTAGRRMRTSPIEWCRPGSWGSSYSE